MLSGERGETRRVKAFERILDGQPIWEHHPSKTRKREPRKTWPRIYRGLKDPDSIGLDMALQAVQISQQTSFTIACAAEIQYVSVSFNR